MNDAQGYIEVSEKTLDDCITTACQKLSVTSDRLDYEVIDQGSAGFLGFNARKAVIRARVKENPEKASRAQGDALAAPAQENTEKADYSKPAQEEYKPADTEKSAREKEEFLKSTIDEFGYVDVEARAAALPPAREDDGDSSDRESYGRSYGRESERGERGERGRRSGRDGGRSSRNSRNSRDSRDSRDSRGSHDFGGRRNSRFGDRRKSEGNYFEIVDDSDIEIPVYDPAEKKEPRVEYTDEQIAGFKERADEFLTALFNAMGIDVEITETFDRSENILTVDFEGDDMGILIGKRGATLDSVQYLVSLVVNKDVEGYVHVKADTENYRARRKKTLENLAKNIAFKVKKTRKSMALEPMNPYERRIIHSTLQGDPYVTTYSEGEDPNRRVVVTLKK